MASEQAPKTMCAVQGKDYGDIDLMLSVEKGVAVPSLKDLPPKKRKNHVVIKTLAVSLAPGDCRVLSGKTRELQGPPSFPYIPGGDCCGIVVEIPEEEKEKLPFGVGDRVAVRFHEKPSGALGEYALVHQAVCDKVPENVSNEDAAALASASPAVLLADRVREGERVLVLGAGGGVGSHLCQLIKGKAKEVVGVAQDADRLLAEPISLREAIDYTKQDPFTMEKWQSDPFDTVIDLGGGAWPRLLKQVENKEKLIVKPASQGGRFLTTTPDNPIFELHSVWAALNLFLFNLLARAIYSRSYARYQLPKYTFAMSLPDEREIITRTMNLAQEGKVKACIDGPFPFSTEGVRQAFRKLESRHPKGKVLIRVAEK